MKQLPVIYLPQQVQSLTEIANNLRGVVPQNPLSTLTPEKLVLRQVAAGSGRKAVTRTPRSRVDPGAVGGSRCRGAMIAYLIRRVMQVDHRHPGRPRPRLLAHPRDPRGRGARRARAAGDARADRQFNHVNNYNRALPVQFWLYLVKLVWHHNLGYSYKQNQQVTSLITERLPKTLVLVGISTILALIVAIPLGILQVVRRNKPVDHILTGVVVRLLRDAVVPARDAPDPVLRRRHPLVLGRSAPGPDRRRPSSADPRGLVLPEITLAAITVAARSAGTCAPR